MSHLIEQLETVMRELLAEQQAMLTSLDAQLASLRTFQIDLINNATREQETSRQRLARIEQRRKYVIAQIMRTHRNLSKPTLTKIAELYPERKLFLLQLRDELANVLAQIQQRTNLINKIVGGVLSHLNGTVRLIAQAASGPSTYSKSGNMNSPSKTGILSAVG